MQYKNYIMIILLFNISTVTVLLKADDGSTPDRGCQQVNVSVDVCDHGGQQQSEIDAFDMRITSVEGSTNQLQADAVNHYSQLDTLNAEVGGLHGQVDSNEARIDAMEVMGADQGSHFEALDNCCSQNQAQIASNEGRITSVEDTTNQLQADAVNHYSQLDTLNAEVGGLHGQADSNEARIDAMETMGADQGSHFEALDNCCNQNQAQIASNEGRLTSVEDTTNQHCSYLDSYGSRLKELESCCEMMHSDIDNPIYDDSFIDGYCCDGCSKMDTCELRLAALESCCEEVQGMTHMHCSYIDSLDNCCNQNQAQIASNEGRITSVENMTNQHCSYIDNLDDCCKQAQSYADICESRLKELESCCEMMHSDIDNPIYEDSFIDGYCCDGCSKMDTCELRLAALESCCEQVQDMTHMHCSYIDKLDHCCDDMQSQVERHDDKLTMLASCCDFLLPPDHYECKEFSSVLFVDPQACDEPGKEFKTIQGALDFIGTPTTFADQKQRYLVLISPGVYDEDLSVPPARIINLFAFGPVTLGDGSGQFFESSTPRNITWEIDPSKEFPGGPAPCLSISSAIQAKPCSMHSIYANGFDLSGTFSVVDYSPTSSAMYEHELHLSSVRIRGEFDTTDDNGRLGAFMQDCAFEQQVNAPNMCMMFVHHCMFNGPVTCNDYGAIRTSSFANGMTVLAGPAPAADAPIGFYDTVLTGTFNSPGSMLLDGSTNYFFKSKGGSLAGGATKVIQTDLTP